MSGINRKEMKGGEKLRIQNNWKKEIQKLRGTLDNCITKKQRLTAFISSTSTIENVDNRLNTNTNTCKLLNNTSSKN